jgi:hypothetical protein
MSRASPPAGGLRGVRLSMVSRLSLCPFATRRRPRQYTRREAAVSATTAGRRSHTHLDIMSASMPVARGCTPAGARALACLLTCGSQRGGF